MKSLAAIVVSALLLLSGSASSEERVVLDPYEYMLREKSLGSEMKMSRAGYKAALALLAVRKCDCLQSPALLQKSSGGIEGVVAVGQHFYEIRFISIAKGMEAIVFVNEAGTAANVMCASHRECVAKKYASE